MTCIVAVEDEQGVWMGCDSASSDGYTISTMTTSKVFTNGPLLIGYTTSWRMGQILQHALVPPVESLTWDVDRWMSTDFPLAVRDAFSMHGWDRAESGVAEGGEFIVAINGRCYEIQEDYAYLRSETGEYAVGSGSDHALGALTALRDYDITPEEKILAALEAAAEHVTSVAGPFDVVRQRA